MNAISRSGRPSPSPLVPADGTTRRLRALAALGWPNTDLGQRLGVTRVQIGWWRSGRHRVVHPRTHERVARLFDELAEQPGPSSRTRVHARRSGWAAPTQWRGIDIDDPAAQPRMPRAPKRSARSSDAA